MLRKRFLIIAMILIIGVICLSTFLVLGPSLPPAPTPNLYTMAKANKLPCVLFYDATKPGSFPASYFTALAGAEVQVDDPQGPDTGRYPADQCFLHGTNDQHTVMLTVTLPGGYTMTQPRQFTYSIPPSSELSTMIDIEQQVWAIGVQK